MLAVSLEEQVSVSLPPEAYQSIEMRIDFPATLNAAGLQAHTPITINLHFWHLQGPPLT
jgi:hypothetical protein